MRERATGKAVGGRAATIAVLALLAVALGGCAASTVADMPVMSMPAGVPARATDVGTYLPVNDMPASREGTTLTPAEQAKIEAELVAARDRQAVVLPAKPSGK